MKLSKKMIAVDDAVRYGFKQYFRQGEVFLGSTGMADRIIGASVEARRTNAWLVAERMCYAKITEHTFRTDRAGRITEIDGRI